jgi:capsular exopolysaccharide synthesis family protein
MTAPTPAALVRQDETLAHAFGIVRRRWFVVALAVAACLAAAVGQRALSTDEYDASVSVVFGSPTLSDSALQVSRGGTDPQRNAATNVLIAESQEVAEAVSRQLGSGAPASALRDQIKVEASENADVLRITATDPDPKRAATVANAFAAQYIRFKARADTDSIDAAETDLRRQLDALPSGASERRGLQDSLERLAALRSVASGDARLLGRATVPVTPAGIGGAGLAALAVILGLAIGLILVFLLESVDRRVNEIEVFEREYRLSALAGIPTASFRFTRADLRIEELEPYRILRSTLEFARVSRELDVLIITSAVPGEGKTTIAIDLAHAIALTGESVTLVELDLRRPTFSQHLDIDPARGVTDALLGREPVSYLLQTPFSSLPNFTVLPAGRLPPNPSELLSTPATTDLLAELAGGSRTVIIDAPPLLPVADSHVLLNHPRIDSALIVARIGLTTRDEVRRARAVLERHPLQPLGLVVTGIPDAERYGYHAYPQDDPTAAPEGVKPTVS